MIAATSQATAVETGLLDRIRVRLTEQRADPTPAAVAEALRCEGLLVGDSAVLEVVDALRLDSVGAGPLEALLRRPGITDVLVNGPDEVYVDDGIGLQRTNVQFADDAAVRRLAQRLAAAAGRRLDDASPFVDVRLRDGTRFHAALAPVASPGTCLSLRVPARAGLSVADLVDAGSLGQAGADLLLALVRTRVAFLVSGGTGSGKTTLLAALLSEVDPRERLVIVEDSSELRPKHPHVVNLESRPGERRGQRGDLAAGPGPASPADAARPAGGGRGSRCGSDGHARRAEHRPRGRLRHRPRQCRSGRARPHRGSRGGRRAASRGRACSAVLRGRRRHPPPARGRWQAPDQ